MKSNRLLSMLATVLMIAATPTFPLAVERATPQLSVSPDVLRACASVESNTRVAATCAKALEKPLSASPDDLKTLAAAAKSGDTDAAKKLLIKNGLTAQQLEGAKIMVKDETGGALAKKVTIEISCCPLTIVITIRF